MLRFVLPISSHFTTVLGTFSATLLFTFMVQVFKLQNMLKNAKDIKDMQKMCYQVMDYLICVGCKPQGAGTHIRECGLYRLDGNISTYSDRFLTKFQGSVQFCLKKLKDWVLF